MIKYETLLKNTQAYKAFFAEKTANKLGHSYMVISEDELACKGLCELMCRAIVCCNGNCGICSDCIRVEDFSHSAIYRPEDLKAESIRMVIEKAYLAVNEGTNKVIVIDNFSEILPAQQNYLLKVLEEPPQNVVFILGVAQASNALNTIKSRCQKICLEELNSQAIKDELMLMNYNSNEITKAVNCCFGSLTKAVRLLDDKFFGENYELWIEILTQMQTSKQVVSMLDKLFKNTKKDKMSKTMLNYCDVLETILKALLDLAYGKNSKQFGELQDLSGAFNVAMLVNIMELVVACRKKLKSNCNAEAVAEGLLMGILEVKYKCR